MAAPPIRQAPPAELGPLLRSVRIRSGLGLRAAARAAGVSHGYLLRLEAGERCPSSAVAAELLRVLPLEDEEATVLIAAGLGDRGRSHPLRARRL
jgi:transcriptional regulator with XRE-family HTH domain